LPRFSIGALLNRLNFVPRKGLLMAEIQVTIQLDAHKIAMATTSMRFTAERLGLCLEAVELLETADFFDDMKNWIAVHD
jgi:hypothetical protein